MKNLIKDVSTLSFYFNTDKSKYLASRVIYFLSKYIGVNCSFEKLTDLLGDSYRIANIESIIHVIEKLEIKYTLCKLDLQRKANKILIILTKENCFLVIPQKFGYRIYDPKIHRITYSTNLAHIKECECIEIKSIEKIKNEEPSSLILFLKKLGVFNLLNVLIAVFTLFYVITIRIYFDYVILKQFNHWFVILAVIFLLIILLQIILHITSFFIKYSIEIKILNSLGNRLYKKIFSLPLEFFEKRQTGRINEYFWAVERVGEAFLNGLFTNLMSIPIIIVLSILMFYLEPKITTISFSILFVYAIFICVILYLKLKSTSNMRAASEEFFSYLSNAIINLETIQSTSREEYELSKIEKYQRLYGNKFLYFTTLDSLIIHLNQIYSFLVPLIIFSLSLFFFNKNNSITVGSIVAYNTIFSIISQLLLQIILGAKDYTNSLTDINLVDDINLYNNFKNLVNVSNLKNNDTIVLSRIFYRYSMDSDYALNNLDLEIIFGQHVAIVGNNGSGKSTLLKLLVGLYFASKGNYTIGTSNITKENYSSLRNVVAYMDQSSYMFNGTLKDNLTLWNTNISTDLLESVIRDCELSELVFSRGLDANINCNSSNISAGEQQRIELARLLIKQPQVLLLDEATSNLDEVTQEKIIRNLRRRKITVIQVAHRLSAIKYCDVIYFMDKGKIVDSKFY